MKKQLFIKKIKTLTQRNKNFFATGSLLFVTTLVLTFAFSNCGQVKFTHFASVGCDVSTVSTQDTNDCKVRSRSITCDGTTPVPGPWGAWDYSACTCPTGSGQTINPSTGVCECPLGQTPNGSGICTPASCNLSGVVKDQSGPCPSGYGVAWRHCTPMCTGTTASCGPWGAWDYSSCSCAPGSGQILNTSTGTCSCPSGQTFNPSSGVCEGTTCGPITTPLSCPNISGMTVSGQGTKTCTGCPATNCTNSYNACTYDASYCANTGNWIEYIGQGNPLVFTTTDTHTTIHGGERCPCPAGQNDIGGVCGNCPITQPIYNSGSHSCSSCAVGQYYIAASQNCQTCQFGYNSTTQSCNPPNMAPVTITMVCSTENNKVNTCSTNIASKIPAGVPSSILIITSGTLTKWFNHGNDWPHTDTAKDVKVQIVGTTLQLEVHQVRAHVSITIAAGPMYTGYPVWYAGPLRDPWCEQDNYDSGPKWIGLPDGPIGSQVLTTEPRCDGNPGTTSYTCYPNTWENGAYSKWMTDIYCESPPGGGGGDTQL